MKPGRQKMFPQSIEISGGITYRQWMVGMIVAGCQDVCRLQEDIENFTKTCINLADAIIAEELRTRER